MEDRNCLFCRIVRGEEKAWIVDEDEKHISFLTPFPNTYGFTVVATKSHLSSYVFNIDAEEYIDLLIYAKKVGLLLDKSLSTRRTGLIMEGMGINHAHIKLFPMHGIPEGEWQGIHSKNRTFFEKYEGYISSHNGNKASERELDTILHRIKDTKEKLHK